MKPVYIGKWGSRRKAIAEPGEWMTSLSIDTGQSQETRTIPLRNIVLVTAQTYIHVRTHVPVAVAWQHHL
jgi:hypothetical protein